MKSVWIIAVFIGLIGGAIGYFVHGPYSMGGFLTGYAAGWLGWGGLQSGIALAADGAKGTLDPRRPIWMILVFVNLPVVFLLYFLVKDQPWPCREAFATGITLVYCAAIAWVGCKPQPS